MVQKRATVLKCSGLLSDELKNKCRVVMKKSFPFMRCKVSTLLLFPLKGRSLIAPLSRIDRMASRFWIEYAAVISIPQNRRYGKSVTIMRGGDTRAVGQVLLVYHNARRVAYTRSRRLNLGLRGFSVPTATVILCWKMRQGSHQLCGDMARASFEFQLII